MLRLIAAAEHHHALAHEIALDVAHLLRHTRGVYPRRTRALQRDGTRRALPAPHCEHDCARADVHKPLLGRKRRNPLRSVNREHHGIEQDFHGGSLDFFHKTVGVLGTRQLLAEVVKPEARVYALVEDSAQPVVALDEHDFRARGFRGERRRHTSGSAADDYDITHLHSLPP